MSRWGLQLWPHGTRPAQWAIHVDNHHGCTAGGLHHHGRLQPCEAKPYPVAYSWHALLAAAHNGGDNMQPVCVFMCQMWACLRHLRPVLGHQSKTATPPATPSPPPLQHQAWEVWSRLAACRTTASALASGPKMRQEK